MGESQAERVEAAPLPRRRILVVDDEPMILVSIKRILGREHDVVTMSEGRRALERIAAGDVFDLILCDLMMPSMTGIELCEALEQSYPEAARRMLFLSGGAFTPRAREFLEHNGHRCLEKPFAAPLLRQLVRDLSANVSR